uniref:Extracellular sulfatase Sulf-2-like n=1 Tax=Stegastes partitus TaxID=144197 RepID=A0A3B5A7Q0_9TELE
MAGRLLLFLCVSVTLGHAHFPSGQRLKPRLQRDRRNIRPNIILILTDDQDLELGSMQAMNKTRRIMEEGGTSFSNAFDYLTDLITAESIRYFRSSKRIYPHRPVLMVLSHAAPHGPEDSAPQYSNAFANLYNMLVETGELENTYIIYTSDHGYHIGQFGLVKGKSMPYEFDIRVPFYIRGPNVEQGSINPHMVLNIDLAPTILDIAGLDTPPDMDGKSILTLLDTDKPKWQCVEDTTGKLRLFKCKNEGGGAKSFQRGVVGRQRPISIKSQLYLPDSDGCDCDLRPLNLRPSNVQNRGLVVSVPPVPSLHVPLSQQNEAPSLCYSEPKPEPSVFSGDGNAWFCCLWFCCRCSILTNATVKCDTGVYESLQAWKDHKLHIDHERKLEHVVRNTDDEDECSQKGGARDKKAWLMKEQKRRKKMRKMIKRIRNNDTCSMPGLTCFTHDNQHWHTAPYWTLGPFCACTSANNNTYWCLRTINETHNFLFCEFATGFLEYFDLNTDPYQLINAVSSLDRTVLNQLHVQLMELRGCRGHKQCNPRTRSTHTCGVTVLTCVCLFVFCSSSGPIWDGWKG